MILSAGKPNGDSLQSSGSDSIRFRVSGCGAGVVRGVGERLAAVAVSLGNKVAAGGSGQSKRVMVVQASNDGTSHSNR